MKITIIDNRPRGKDLQNQILEFDLPNIESIEYFSEIVIKKINLHDNPQKIKDSDLVPVTNNSLLLIHGRNAHCGWYVQKRSQAYSIPTIIYTGGSNYVKLKGNQLAIDDKQYDLDKPENTLTIPQAVQNADTLNLREALLFLNEHPKNIEDFFSLVLGRTKKMKLSLQLIHNCLTPERINKTVLNKGKLNNIIKSEGWLPEESISLIEGKIINLARQKDRDSKNYENLLNELKHILLPELYTK